MPPCYIPLESRGENDAARSDRALVSIDRTPARPGIDTRMEAKKLKLFPIAPELGDHYAQFQKEFREIFGR
jgi:hypothetical protein